MPVLFVASGCLLISILFGFVDFDSVLNKVVCLFATIVFMVGYFMPDVFVNNISFNVFYVLTFLVLFFVLFVKVGFVFFDLIFLLGCGLVYNLLLDRDLSFMIEYNISLAGGLVLILLLIYSSNFYKCVFMSLLLSSVILLLSSCCGLDNFGVLSLDFLFCIEVLFITSLFFVICKLFYCSVFNWFRRGVLYGKKTFCFSNIGFVGSVF